MLTVKHFDTPLTALFYIYYLYNKSNNVTEGSYIMNFNNQFKGLESFRSNHSKNKGSHG